MGLGSFEVAMAKLDRGLAVVFWCDRCQKIIEPGQFHHHDEQCGGCQMYDKIDSDFGFCKNRESVFLGRRMFEHDTCSKHIYGEWA